MLIPKFDDPKVFSDPYSPQTSMEFERLVGEGSGGIFIGRIGGSDFEAVAQSRSKAEHLRSASVSAIGKILQSSSRVPYVPPFALQHQAKVRSLNGYFDTTGSKKRYRQYLDTLHEAYSETVAFTYASRHIQEALDKGLDTHPALSYLRSVTSGKSLLTYSFIELVDPLVTSMKTWAKGKKVLFVSPFSATVRHQLGRRSQLLKNSQIPEFEVITYSTPVTYSSIWTHKKKPFQAKTENWNSESKLIQEEVLALEFDVALLSCASYSMPLGVAIQRSGRAAVYLGGALNPLLNIYGERFARPPYTEIMNPETTVDPLELPELEQIREGRRHPNEAMRAYIRNRNRN